MSPAVAIFLLLHDGLAVGRPGNDGAALLADVASRGMLLNFAPHFVGIPNGDLEYTVDGMSINDPAFNVPMIRPLADFVGSMQTRPEDGPYSGGQLDFSPVEPTNQVRGALRMSFMPRLRRPRLTLVGEDAVVSRVVPRFGLQSAMRVNGAIVDDRLFFTVGAAVTRSWATLQQSFRAGNDTFAENAHRIGAIEGQGHARLEWLITWRHRVWASTFVTPQFTRRSYRHAPDDPEADFPGPRLTTDPLTQRPTNAEGPLDGAFGWDRGNAVAAIGGYQGRVADERLEVDARFGFVHAKQLEAWRLDNPDLRRIPVEVRENVELPDVVQGTAQSCADAACPVSRWTTGGIGPTQQSRSRRLGGRTALRGYFNAWGSHALESVLEAEHTERRRTVAETSHRVAGQNYAVVLRDQWALLSNLYLLPGLRWDAQDIRDTTGRRVALIADNVAPRAGIVYDWTNEGRSRLFASYGRHYQQLPLALFDGVDAPGRGLDGQYDEQFEAGYEHEVAEDVIVGTSWLHRELGRAVLPDTLDNAKALRNTDAFTFEARRRFSRGWAVSGSYTYAREIGNFYGFFDPFTGFVDRSPQLGRNSFGPLPTSAPHRLKLDVIAVLGFDRSDLSLAASFRVVSGRPVSVKAGDEFLLPRGEAGRLDPLPTLNLHVAYAYTLGDRRGTRLQVGVRLFNVTNARARFAVDEQYTRQQTRPIAGGDATDLKHARVGSASLPTRFFNRQVVAPSETFGRTLGYQLPLSGQFDLRLLF